MIDTILASSSRSASWIARALLLTLLFGHSVLDGGMSIRRKCLSWRVDRVAIRICPGKALAENSLFILVATILATLNISLPPDGQLKPRFGENLVRYL